MKQLLKVARMGHPVLRQVAEPVEPDVIQTAEFQDFVDSMYLTMLEYEGVGLAAPQVHQSTRVVVFHEEAGLEDNDGQPLICLINPVITPLTEGTAAMWEGCLSIPGLRGKVSRPRHVRVEGITRDGQELKMELEDFAAIVVQHECDHLDGKLFIDRLDDTRELAYTEEFEKYLVPQVEADEDTYIDS